MNGARVVRQALTAMTAAERGGDAVCARLQEQGFPAFRVGGSVRDRLLGRVVSEVDVATGAPPQQVRRCFPCTYEVGERFGVVIVHVAPGVDVEVAAFREDADYADGRHPTGVRFADAGGDARRRDFTINALYYDPVREELLDFVGGLDDLRRGLVRAIGDPAARFGEDHLRLLRAVRFVAEFGFAMEPVTRAAIRPLAPYLGRLSAERIHAELSRMLCGRAPHLALGLLGELGLLDTWLPELRAMSGVTQSAEFHPEGDVWQHTLVLLACLRSAGEVLAWSALLHDVGKPVTHRREAGVDRFPNHAAAGAQISAGILHRLKASRRLIEGVTAVVANHMAFPEVRNMRPATLRRLLARPTFPDELELHRLDCLASHGRLENYRYLLDALHRFESEPVLPPPLLRGEDVLALGLPPGPSVGAVLRSVREAQLNGEICNRDEALARAQAWLVRSRAPVARPVREEPANE